MVNGEHVGIVDKAIDVVIKQMKTPAGAFILGLIFAGGVWLYVHFETIKLKDELLKVMTDDRNQWRDRYNNSFSEMSDIYQMFNAISGDKEVELIQSERISEELEEKNRRLEELEKQLK